MIQLFKCDIYYSSDKCLEMLTWIIHKPDNNLTPSRFPEREGCEIVGFLKEAV